MNPSSRRGFTLVELLVVIAIIGTLVGLLLPAVNAARARARQAQCLNNMKELSTALVSYATDGKGEFPGWVQVQKLSPGSGGPTYSGVTTKPDVAISWAAKLLPKLDQAGLWDQLVSNNSGNGFNYITPPRLDLFLCPSDAGTNQELALLNYVGNTGYFDADPNTDITTQNYTSDLKQNGLMHDLRPGRKGPTVRLGADIKDGAGTTLLLSENIHKDEDAVGYGGDKNTWLGLMDPLNGGAVKNDEQRYGMVWVFDDSNLPNSALSPTTQAPLNRDLNNAAEFGTSGQYYARPASAHPEVFNASFAGGSAKSINENIEYRVYQQLMTSNGAKAADPLNPDRPVETYYRPQFTGFMNQPLAESDF